MSGFFNNPKTYILPRRSRLGKEVQAYIEAKTNQDRIPAEEIFPDAFDSVKGPAIALRGMRHREELTQKKLATMLDIRQHHLSEMENCKRSIGKEMAKKTGKNTTL